MTVQVPKSIEGIGAVKFPEHHVFIKNLLIKAVLLQRVSVILPPAFSDQ